MKTPPLYRLSVLTLFTIYFCFNLTYAQPNFSKEKADSLWSIWQDESQADTNRLKALHDYSWDGYVNSKPDSALYYAKIQYNFAVKKGIKKQIAKSLNTQAKAYENMGEYKKAIEILEKNLDFYKEINNPLELAKTLTALGSAYQKSSMFEEALKYHLESLELKKEFGNPFTIAVSHINIGVVYENQGVYAKAIEYFTNALIVFEETNNLQAISMCQGNIANIYYTLKDYEKALTMFTEVCKGFEEIGDKHNLATALNNLGNAYYELDSIKTGIGHFKKALEISQETNNLYTNTISLNNLGNSYKELKEYETALNYYQEGLEKAQQINSKHLQSALYNNIGKLYYLMNDFDKSILFCQKSLNISNEIGVLKEIRNAYKALFMTYKKTNNHSLALEMHEKYILMRDSIESEENHKEVINQNFKYEYEKQQAVKDAEHEAQLEISAIEKKRQKTITYAVTFGLGLLLIFSLFIYNRFKVTQKQKNIIEEKEKETQKQKEVAEHQKHLVEEKNKEILDSINYAKRIQTAILPPPKVVKSFLDDSFILYLPKDIVAGDFYWMESLEISNPSPVIAIPSSREKQSLSQSTRKILFAAADCTGHGVPGAMVSVICNNGLNRSVREYGITEPGKILDKTREIVIEEFQKSEEEVKDGMDIALCCLETTNDGFHLQYAGANNPLWIIRNGGSEVEEIKANKQPIGKYADNNPFTTHNVKLEKGDSIYIFTDGFQDQFGGEKGKKFKPANLRKLILSIQNLPMPEQREAMLQAFDQWKGDLEQIDDVCIIGVRL